MNLTWPSAKAKLAPPRWRRLAGRYGPHRPLLRIRYAKLLRFVLGLCRFADTQQGRGFGSEVAELAAQFFPKWPVCLRPLDGLAVPFAGLFLSPSCQWVMAMKNQSVPSPPWLSAIDFSK